MINSHNTFSPLKEMILGDVDIHSINFDDPRKQKRVEHIFAKTKIELDNFQTALQAKGITVHRPKQIKNVPIQTPYWSTAGTKIPLTPRDLFLVLGDTIIEMAMCEQERLFEPFSNIFRASDERLPTFGRGSILARQFTKMLIVFINGFRDHVKIQPLSPFWLTIHEQR